MKMRISTKYEYIEKKKPKNIIMETGDFKRLLNSSECYNCGHWNPDIRLRCKRCTAPNPEALKPEVVMRYR